VRYLIDTDWVADHLANRPDATRLLASLFDEGIAISLVTYGEIYEGIFYGRRYTQSLEIAFLELLRRCPVLSLDESIMRRFAAVRGGLRREGRLIGDADTLIAATALHHDLTLVTRNLDHFRRVPDLKIHGET
jgi:predicted nucleic acid-binding protein